MDARPPAARGPHHTATALVRSTTMHRHHVGLRPTLRVHSLAPIRLRDTLRHSRRVPTVLARGHPPTMEWESSVERPAFDPDMFRASLSHLTADAIAAWRVAMQVEPQQRTEKDLDAIDILASCCTFFGALEPAQRRELCRVAARQQAGSGEHLCRAGEGGARRSDSDDARRGFSVGSGQATTFTSSFWARWTLCSPWTALWRT